MRTVKTTSGATAVQVVWSSRRGSREIEHLGSAHDEAELEALKAAAQQRMTAGQQELDLGLGSPGPSGPLPITSSRMSHLVDALERAYRVLGLEDAASGDEVFQHLVLARNIEPASKLDSLRVLEEAELRRRPTAPSSGACRPTRRRSGGSGCRRPARRTPGSARPAWCSTTCPLRHRELVQDAVGQEAGVGAVQGGGEPVRHPGQQGDDLVEVVQAAATAQLFGVVHGGLEAQDVLALGISLQLQPPEADPESAQAVLWFLDHDVLRWRAVLAVAMGPRLEAEQRPQRRDVQPGPVRSRIRSKSVSIWAPERNSRFREYSVW